MEYKNILIILVNIQYVFDITSAFTITKCLRTMLMMVYYDICKTFYFIFL